MPIETVPGTSLKYYLIAFDASGKERDEHGELMSQKILEALASEPITDVFIMSHGWMGDIPGARDQYNKWIGAMAKQTADLEKITQARPFRPLMIGVHWPSKPWGNEDLTSASVSFGVNDADPVDSAVDEYAERIANTEEARQALQTIFRKGMEDSEPDTLPPEVVNAYQVLNQEAGLGSEGGGGAPGSDWEGFDPEGIYQASHQEPVSFSAGSSFDWDKFLTPLRLLSFWTMKDRARKIGESAGFNLLKALQQNTPETVRFHLMGHSFGCVLVSAALAGPKGQGKLVRPVNSLVLVQGAMSLWSYCSKISYERNRPGYFNPLIVQGKVAGPIVTTQSHFDYAVGKMYPLAGKIVFSRVDFAAGGLPKYGGIGCFGLCGNGFPVEDINMLGSDASYQFKPGKVYNLESSKFINDVTDKFVGAHNDFAKPEVAHVLWSAVSGS
ncbi:hypothetical protein NDI44_12255 [Trichocoleus sp. DQ-A3]|uniref:hypothetical protein n=1 Tax=Cyanophyceae TaxID=3028117 RepID=UPI001682CBA1|nr:hypothetical protein [Coleofasciculus sp. FACHB-125]MBD1899892.1 hypothetical protein [Coleofasciculus sp. FACHB-125]